MEGTTRLEELFSRDDTIYVIPTYQRGYSWETDHVEEFLEDLKDAHDPSVPDHFFGTMLLAKTHNFPNNTVKIIDGQQRFTTVLLFLICARNYFYTHKGDEQADKHFDRLEEYIHKCSKCDEHILTLSRTNKRLFVEIVDDKEFRQSELYSKSNDSNELLTNAYRVIQNGLKEYIGEYAKDDIKTSIEVVHEFIRTLFQKFIVYKYNYDNEEKAYKVFNLVNNRGAGLNESDLVKNYLFGKLAAKPMKDNMLDGYDDVWDGMRGNITNKKHADYPLDRFFYHYLLVVHGDMFQRKISKDDSQLKHKGALQLKQKKVFSGFEKLIKNNCDPHSLINEMAIWSVHLDDLRNPTNDIFSHRDNLIHYLTKIKDVKAVFVYPAILAGYKEYWLKNRCDEFEALVTMCFKYHVRIKVIGTSLSIGSYQDIMYEITNDINQGLPFKSIVENIVKNEEKYPGNDRVLKNLQELRVSNSKLAIALLEEAEYKYNKKNSRHDVTVEHIMPKNSQKWEDYIETYKPEDLSAKEFHGQYVSLLGNQTLLSGKKNTSVSNESFAVKKTAYKNDQTYTITQHLANVDVWNAASIKYHQNELADAIVETIDLQHIVDRL